MYNKNTSPVSGTNTAIPEFVILPGEYTYKEAYEETKKHGLFLPSLGKNENDLHRAVKMDVLAPGDYWLNNGPEQYANYWGTDYFTMHPIEEWKPGEYCYSSGNCGAPGNIKMKVFAWKARPEYWPT